MNESPGPRFPSFSRPMDSGGAACTFMETPQTLEIRTCRLAGCRGREGTVASSGRWKEAGRPLQTQCTPFPRLAEPLPHSAMCGPAQGGGNAALQVSLWKMIQSLINHNTRINLVLRAHSCKPTLPQPSMYSHLQYIQYSVQNQVKTIQKRFTKKDK